MADFDKIPPLPRELRQEARRLGAQQPSTGFDRRLRAALARSDSSMARPRPQPSWWHQVWAALALALATAAALALALRAAGTLPNQKEVRLSVAAVDVILGEKDQKDHTWINVNIPTHYHNGNNATVHVEVPHSMAVMPVASLATANNTNVVPACAGGTCVYRFEHPRMPPELLSLRLGVRTRDRAGGGPGARRR